MRAFLLLFVFPVCLSASQEFMDPDSAASRQAEATLRRMTLSEKIGQMAQVDSGALGTPADVEKYALGSVLSGGGSDPKSGNSPADWAAMVSGYRRAAERTRLGVPLLYGIDAVHGHNNVEGAVIFPHNIGLGATRNPKLVEQAARATAEEIAATGINWDFAPCVAVVRDERWGRTYESFGESPELVAELGAAYVRGLQGPGLAAGTSILACAKHFVADGGTWRGKDQGEARIGEEELRHVHLPGYAAAIEAGVGSIMVSYSSWNSVKIHGHRELLTDVLKGELGFQGFLVSDWAAIDQLPGGYRSDIERSINAGLDMVMLPAGLSARDNYHDFLRLLEKLVREGRIPMERIDDAVRRILRVKYAMALDARPLEISASALASIGSRAHRRIARECVRQSLVLLKNENVLPLEKGSRIVVAGRLADDLGAQCGGWTIDWQGRRGRVTPGGTTLLEGIRATVQPGTQVTYSPVGKNLPEADVAIVVAGETPYAEFFGDRRDLRLDRVDRITIERCRKAGLPVVLVLLSGRPLIVTEELPECAAVVAAWLPGTEGQGVADALFGDVEFRGKLPVSWPRSMRQVPINIGDPGYAPLFPFGFGLTN